MSHEAPLTDVFGMNVPNSVLDHRGSHSLVPEGDAVNPEKRPSIVPVDAEKGLGVNEIALDSYRRDSVVDFEKYPLPTDEERHTLRKVADSIPRVAWWLCLVEFAERASYYGANQVFSNFMEFPLPKGGNGAGSPPRGTEETAGALDQGEQFANAFVLLFQFLAYLVPIFGAWLADVKLGRYKTIMIGVIICGIAHVIMIGGAAPSLLRAGHGLAPFVLSLLLLAFGAGVFKPNIAPTIMDQYVHKREYTRVLKSGEKVLVDPETTINRIMLVFYALVNVGAFFGLATTYAEKDVGYWLAFLLPGIVYFLLPALLILLYKKLVLHPPNGSVLTQVIKITALAIKENRGQFWKKDFWNNVKPSTLQAKGVTKFRGKDIGWNDALVDDVRRTFEACAVFLYIPIYNLNDGGVGNVLTNQGAAMTTNGAPNDLLSNFNSLTIIVTVPLLSYVVYPALRKYKIPFNRISRMTFGYILAAISGMIGAIVQWKVYETSPCGYYASDCDIGNGVSPISIWWQIPNVSLGAISECFVNVTSYELAYARAPKGMESIVMSIFLFMTALSAALGEILTPAIIDPHLIWVWGGLAIALAVQTVIFWFRYRNMNNDEFMTYTKEDTKEDTVIGGTSIGHSSDAGAGSQDENEKTKTG